MRSEQYLPFESLCFRHRTAFLQLHKKYSIKRGGVAGSRRRAPGGNRQKKSRRGELRDKSEA